MKPLFTLGRVVATPGAPAAIGVSGDDISTYLVRHQSGDWGGIDAHDRKENQLSLEQGCRLMSVYTLSITAVRIWVIARGSPINGEVELHLASLMTHICRNLNPSNVAELQLSRRRP